MGERRNRRVGNTFLLRLFEARVLAQSRNTPRRCRRSRPRIRGGYHRGFMTRSPPEHSADFEIGSRSRPIGLFRRLGREPQFNNSFAERLLTSRSLCVSSGVSRSVERHVQSSRSRSELVRRAGLSLSTVKRVQAGSGPRVSDQARRRIQQALEIGGVQFIAENGGGPGVRLRKRPRPKATTG